MLFIEITLWLGIGLILHSYVIYPKLVQYFSKYRKNNELIYLDELPPITIIIPAHNEEKVIGQKLETLLQSKFPLDRIELLIGADNCKDQTSSIITSYQDRFPDMNLIEFTERQGKINIVNKLVNKAKHEIIVMTDANVLFDTNTLNELVKHFKNPKIGLVDSRMEHFGLKETGISMAENGYISNEVQTKFGEGKIWGAMMGPFGGCFAFRKVCFQAIPTHFLVDDFYLNMIILQQGYQCINEQNARVFEDVSNESWIEFKRKIRISAGNFQNLSRFWTMLFRFDGISYAFFSHKFLRWILPFFMLFILVGSSILSREHIVYTIMNALFIIPLGLYIPDYLGKKIGVHFKWVRYIVHFTSMNIALFLGFFKFLGGIKSSIWEPTKRLQ
jgi:cellulose synthase/poly-beta-1,6-N-acetylglucosamine synthase-like glycosyltransferase